MNKQLVLIAVAIIALLSSAYYLYTPLQDHTDCFQYHDASKCSHMGCYWDGSMCHDQNAFTLQQHTILQKHQCPDTMNEELCKKSGCEMFGTVCGYID